MESVAPLLRAFYTQPLTSESRAEVHRALLASLSDPKQQNSAVQYLSQITTNPQPVDPYLIHHSLHTVETLVRTSFPTIPQSDRESLNSLLLNFLTHAYERHLSDLPQTHQIPPHAVNKAAAALVALSKRLWLANLSDFPSTLLRLVDSPAHTTQSLASLLAGHAILTTLLDDVLSPRRDLLAADATRLRRLVVQRAPHFLTALEVALRAAGPRFPPHIAPTAARAVATLARLEPSVASHAAAMLTRSALNRYDAVGAHILTSVADILSTPATVDCVPVVDTVVAALCATAAPSENVHRDVPSPLLAVVDALITRLVSVGASASNGIEAVLNGLMGVTVRWAADTPQWLPRALDAWMSVLDVFADADQQDHPLLPRVYDSVVKLCADRAFFATNAQVLRGLGGKIADMPLTRALPSPLDWDAVAEKMADVVQNPSGPSAPALFFDNAGDVDVVREDDEDDDDEADAGDGDGWDGCTARVYSAKCVEVIAVICQMSKGCALDVAQLVCRVLSAGRERLAVNRNGGGIGVGNGVPDQGVAENVADMYTALSLAYALGGVLPPGTAQVRGVCEAVCSALVAGVWRTGRTGVIAMRAAGAFVPYIVADCKEGNGGDVVAGGVGGSGGASYSEWGRAIIGTLVRVAKEIMVWQACSERLATAAALVCVGIDDACHGTVFTDGPPIAVDVVTETSFVGVGCLGVGAMARWAVVPGKDGKGVRVRWSDEEWVGRERRLQQMCERVFGNLQKAAEMGEGVANPQGVAGVGRLIGLLRTLLLSVHGMHGRTADAFWRVVGKDAAVHLVWIVRALGAAVVKGVVGDDEEKRLCAGVMAAGLNCVGSLALTCGAQVGREGGGMVREAVVAAMGVAQSGIAGRMRVAQAVMRLIRDRLAAGEDELVAAGVELATGTVKGVGADGEVCEVAVSLLSEGLKRHWLKFWPGDKVGVVQDVEGGGSVMAAGKGKDVVDGEVSKVYFAALGGVVAAVQSELLGVCRAGLLALEQLNASRRLYRREAAFRTVGAARAVAVECLRIVGGGGDASRESLADEAVEVVWGIASVDLQAFVGGLAEIVKEVLEAGGAGGGGGGSGSGGVEGKGARRVEEAAVVEVVKGLHAVEDRGAFGRAFLAMANDMVYYSRMAPTL